MGEHYIDVKENKNGNQVATLHSASNFAMLRIENCNNGTVRIKEMELGSTHVTLEHLAILINETGLKDELMTALKVIK